MYETFLAGVDKCILEKHMNGRNDNSGTNASQQNNGATTDNKAVLPPEFVGRIKTPYGVQYINSGEAYDHATMRSTQLSALLMMMQHEGAARFALLSPRLQDSYIWMLTELSAEVEEMINIAADDVLRSVK